VIVLEPLKLLTKHEIYRIHLATLEILEDVGVFFHNEQSLKLFDQAGAVVDYDKELVKIPEHMVNDALDSAPSRVTFLARNPKYNLNIGGGKVHYTNGYGADHVLDLETGERRLANVRDLENFTLLSDYLENVHYVMANITPQDVPLEICDRYMAYAMLRNTSKHCCLVINSADSIDDIINMVSVMVGGKEEFTKNPTIINSGLASNPPLRYSKDCAARIMELARNGIPLELSSGILAGATGPITLAGSIVMANAEDLAGLVLAQLVKPGAPVLYGSLVTILDMRYAVPVFGSPECGLINVAFTQIAHYYEIPYFATAGVIDSKVPDEQAAHECTLNVLLTALAGGDIIHDAVYGILETGKTACYEQFVISNEIVDAINRILKGFSVNDDTLPMDLIKAVGPGHNYLKDLRAVKYAKERILKEHWYPKLFDRATRTKETQTRDILERAKEKVKEILKMHKPEPLLEKDVEMKMYEVLKRSICDFQRKRM
jgi:trimethylamine--corrinoid protein Co-methyltransferase